MKKLFAVLVAMTFVVSLGAVAFAAEKPAAEPMKKEAAPAKAAEPMKKEAAPKAEAKKPAAKAKQVTGTIEALDAAKGTFSVKGKKETVELKAGEKVKLDGLAVGDKVLVKYSEGTASSVKKVTAKAAPKKEAAPKAEPMKKEMAPAPKAAPAPAEKK